MVGKPYPFWKNLRILILLLILLVVAVNAWFDQNQDWDKTIRVLLHPVNADNDPKTQAYIDQLTSQDFRPSQDYLQQNIAKYYQKPTSVYIEYGRIFAEKPPVIPSNPSVIDVMLWSLKFRYYAWQHESADDKSPTATLYLNYYNPDKYNSLKHSTALEKGRIGVVNLFASQKQHGANQVVMVHELLHTFGATDKYDLTTGQPIDPIGLAEPNKSPKYPQQYAELMGGYIPTTPNKSHTPNDLSETVINELTAREVGWLK